MKKTTLVTNHIFQTVLFLFVILTVSLTACKKFGKSQLNKLDKTGKELVADLTKSADNFTAVMETMPDKFGEKGDSLIKKVRTTQEILITQLDGMLEGRIDTAGMVFKEITDSLTTDMSNITNGALDTLGGMLEYIGQLYTVTTGEHIKSMGGILDTTMTKAEAIMKSFGTSMQVSVDTISAAMARSSSDLKEITKTFSLDSRETALLMTGKLDTLFTENILLADSMIEKRIDQLAWNANRLLDTLDTKMNALTDKISKDIDLKIEVVTWNSLVIVERTADITNEVYGKMNITTVRTYSSFIMLGSIAFFILGVFLDKIELRRRNIFLLVLLLGVCGLTFSDEVMYTLYGKKHILVKDFRKMANDNYDKIYATLAKGTNYDDNELISLCEDTFEMYARCIVLTSPKNISRRSRYEEQMENLQYAIKVINES